MESGARDEPGIGFEPWAKAAFAVTGLVALLFIYLGLRRGGPWPVRAYTFGPLTLGALAALQLVYGIVKSFVSRPVLQRGRLQALACLSACLWLCSFPFAYPSSHEGHPSTTAFRLPFEGTWSVRWGGERREENILVLNPSRRFGYAFEPPAGERSPLVLAPAPGLLIQFGDGNADSAGDVGTRLVLQVGDREFLVLEGLQRGSARVAVGEAVEGGDPLGTLVEDALTLFLQDSPDVGRGEGIPILFRDFVAEDRSVERGGPIRGQRVADGPAPR